jgi:inorganic pyrophosphatase
MLKNVVFALKNKSARNFSKIYLNREKTLCYEIVSCDDKRERHYL